MDQTKIEWTDFTVNFWEGCQNVGPGCDHCYAEARNIRFAEGKHWGPGAPRRKVKGGIAKLQKINREAGAFHEKHGRYPRVFCSSLSDVFDNAVDEHWRDEAFTEIFRAQATHIQLLTKRVGNVEKMIPALWHKFAWPQHVGLMITVVNQAEADRDIPKLLELKARLGIPWVGLSVEPMLGVVAISKFLWGCTAPCPECPRDGDCDCAFEFRRDLPDAIAPGSIDWVICGGESGRSARAMNPDWAVSLRDQCAAAKVAFLFKQWGEWGPCEHLGDDVDGMQFQFFSPERFLPSKSGHSVFKAGKGKTGRAVDHRVHNGFPAALI